MSEEPYTVSPKEAGERTSLSERTWRDWFKAGKVDGKYVGTKLLLYWGNEDSDGNEVIGVKKAIDNLSTVSSNDT